MTKYQIPDNALEFRFVHASGPGGQHVNKASTAVELRIDLQQLQLDAKALRRLKVQQANRINKTDQIVIQADRFRSQLKNKNDALQRAKTMIEQALVQPKKRIPTSPSRAAKQRRLNAKKIRGDVKHQRKKPTPD